MKKKDKQYFEYYNKEKGIIKMTDGNLYKIIPVVLKNINFKDGQHRINNKK